MPLSISPEKIKEIAENLDCGLKCFYHIATGEIESYPDELKNPGFDEEMWEETINKVETNYKEYMAFEGMESRDSFRMMERFINSIDDEKIRIYFTEAISLKKPFQQFKYCLQEYVDLQQQWYKFKDEQLIIWVQEQLEAYNNSMPD